MIAGFTGVFTAACTAVGAGGLRTSHPIHSTSEGEK